MPWSEWITPDPEPWSCEVAWGVSTRDSGAGYDDADAAAAVAGARALMDTGATTVTDLYGIGRHDFTMSPNAREAAAVPTDPGVTDFHAIVGGGQMVKWFDTADLGGVGVPNVRNWFPLYLSGLTYGVDYIERPDRGPFDDDAFVEYEAGDSEHVGWIANATVEIGVAQVNTDLTDIATGQVILETGWSTPATLPGLDDILASDPVWSTGTVVAEVTGVTGATSGLVDFSGSVPLVSSLAVIAAAPRTATGVILEDGEYMRTWSANVAASVHASIQYPRWRYWIPGEPYVRLLHRGDGLGLSSRRLRQRGHTNQAGRLRGGY